MVRLLHILTALFILGFSTTVRAEPDDPFDPFDDFFSESLESNEGKSAEQLLLEGTILMEEERLLDGRSKLLAALAKDPKEFRAHLLLGGYYMVHVGHFRLALRYVRQGQKLFEERYGPPPYTGLQERAQHGRILYLLSQARLNLDDYKGALAALDEYTSWGYYDEWYPGTRAWVLMKLGRLEEAIKVARTGLFGGAETGRTLNMLGILLSMTGERLKAIDIFRQAIAYEFALGKLGQPATPLNNMGEVFEEIFREQEAQDSYRRATTLPDGCEHVLPSLNLAKLYLDELDFARAKTTMDNFESCVANYPLRNGEEHRALVHLARGRIALQTGFVEEAIRHFRAAYEKRQWFGKIGTNEDDLKAGVLSSLSHALQALTNVRSATVPESVWDSMRARAANAETRIESWWHSRRTRQILIEDLSDFEDLYIRNTDSMLDYPTLGRILAALPTKALRTRLEKEEKSDDRANAGIFYRLYLAEAYVQRGDADEALRLLNEIIGAARPRFDNGVLLRALLLKLMVEGEGSVDSIRLANRIFALSRAALRVEGLRLPVHVEAGSNELSSLLEETSFLPQTTPDIEYNVRYELREGDHVLTFIPIAGKAQSRSVGVVSVRDADLAVAVNKLNESVFRQKL